MRVHRRSLLRLAIVVSVLLMQAQVALAYTPPDFVRRWGSQGSAVGQFRDPVGMGIDVLGNLYVADTGNHRIQVFDANGAFVRAFGSYGGGDGQFYYPLDVVVDLAGNIYVSDFGGRIQVFDANASFVRAWRPTIAGIHIALDPTGQYLYLVWDSTVYKYDLVGNFIRRWVFSSQRPSTGPGIGVGPDGSVYVNAQGDQKILKFSQDGQLVLRWGEPGTTEGHFRSPQALAVDYQGGVYVVDALSRVQQFTSSGEFRSLWGGAGPGDGEFYAVVDFAIDSNLGVYVLDQSACQIQLFRAESTPAMKTSWGHVKSLYGGTGRP